MANPRFPVRLFAPSEWKPPYIVGAALSGGQPVSGAAQTADASAGGLWYCDHQVGILRTLDQILAWRAIVARLTSGMVLFDVPFVEGCQPWPGGVRPARTPFSDMAPFSDGSEFVSAPIVAELGAAAYMMASPAPPAPPTQATLLLSACAALRGGEYFSIASPTLDTIYLHLITSIVSRTSDAEATAGAPVTAVVTISPPFREDIPAGTAVDFNEPRFTAKANIASIADAWPTMSPPFTARPKISFIESGAPIPSEG